MNYHGHTLDGPSRLDVVGPVPHATFSVDSIIVGRNARMRAIVDFVKVIADSESSVLIMGETGSGKEVIANLLHVSSARRHKAFVPVSCAIFSETLIESELFGHERGAFTGAINDRPGRFELANGGTIFLDDVDDVPMSMQVKLLRVIQTRTIERLGGTRHIPVDVRIIAGSKSDLRQLVDQGKFREDLYYRLYVIPIHLPPLRERREDIPELVNHFLTRFFRQRGEDPPPISPTVMRALTNYSWPGNVRELENICERMAQTCTCGTLRIGCVPPAMLFKQSTDESRRPAATDSAPAGVSLDDRLREVETSLVTWALKVSGGNKSRAAELLKIKRSTLGDRLRKLIKPLAGSPDGQAQNPDSPSKQGQRVAPECLEADALQENSAHDDDEVAKGDEIGDLLYNRRHVLDRKDEA
jgi:DNA-binding NtrC family response regulator